MAQERPDSAYAEVKHYVRRYGAATVTLLLAALFLWRVRAQLPPFVIAIILAVLLEPLMRRLTRRGMSRTLGAVIIVVIPLVVVGGLLIVLMYVAATEVARLVQEIDRVKAELSGLADELSRSWSSVVNALSLPPSLSKEITRIGPWLSHQIGLIWGYLQSFVSKIVWLALIPIATFYLLADGPRARDKILACLSERNRQLGIDLAHQIGSVFAGYVRGVITISILYGLAMATVFTVLGMPQYAMVVAGVAAVFYVLPYVGPLATLVVSVALGYIGRDTSWAGSWAVVAVGCGVLGFNAIFDNLLFPRIVGGKVKLHPLVAIFAMLSGYAVMGVAGMILAIPLAASIQVVVVYLFPALMLAEKAAALPARPLAGPAAPAALSPAPLTTPAQGSGTAAGRPRRRRPPRRRPGSGPGTLHRRDGERQDRPRGGNAPS